MWWTAVGVGLAAVIWIGLQLRDRGCVLRIWLGGQASDVKFSPNGTYLAVACETHSFFGGRSTYSTYVFGAKDGSKVLEVKKGGTSCAWNADGSLLATARLIRPDEEKNPERKPTVELWNTASWTIQDELQFRTVPLMDYVEIGSLCFDRVGNLFAASMDILDPHTGWDERPQVWWMTHAGRSVEASAINATPDATSVMSISTAVRDNEDLIAISDRSEGTFLLTTRKNNNGESIFKLIHTFAELPAQWVQLTPDGNYLAVLGRSGFKLYRLSNDKVELVAKSTEGEPHQWRLPSMHPLAVSADSRFVGCRWSGELTQVFRVTDGACVLRLMKPSGAIAISPDGRHLVINPDGYLCFYEIPQSN